MKPLSLRAARALFPPKANPHLADQDAFDRWNHGSLSPRQSAGFYEIAPSTTAREKGNAYPAAIARYRERIRLIYKVCQWRRQHPQPEGGHWTLYKLGPRGATIGRVFVAVRSRNDEPPEMAAYRLAAAAWDKLTKKQRVASGASAPERPLWEFHDTLSPYGPKSTCPGCVAWTTVIEEWVALRVAAFAKLGVELDPDEKYHGQEVALWPDGSWSGECLKYPPLPIRSVKAVPRIPPKEATK